MKSIEKRLVVGIISILLILIGVSALAYRSMVELFETATRVAHAHEVLTELKDTLSMLRDAHTSGREYVITGEESYLEPYMNAVAGIEQHLTRLKRLLADNVDQQGRLTAAESLISIGFADLNQMIDARASPSPATAQPQVLMKQGKQHMDDLRRLFAEIENQENEPLQRRIAESEVGIQRTAVAFVAAVLLLFALLFLIYNLVRRDIAARARLETALRGLATHDELTGLYNRREMNHRLAEEVVRCQRYRRPLSLVLLDIDHFKAINDTYGHQVGDEVLRWVASLLRANARPVDMPARFGGEEFAIILPEITREEAFTAAERFRQQIAAQPFRWARDDEQPLEIPITLSAGAAELWSDDDHPEAALVAAADKALYQAKHEGRNRTCVLDDASNVIWIAAHHHDDYYRRRTRKSWLWQLFNR